MAVGSGYVMSWFVLFVGELRFMFLKHRKRNTFWDLSPSCVSLGRHNCIARLHTIIYYEGFLGKEGGALCSKKQSLAMQNWVVKPGQSALINSA